MRDRTQMLHLVAELAVAGLNHISLTPEDRADAYDGLAAFLAKNESEAAHYAATCIRECQRAQQDFLSALAAKKGSA